MRFRNMLQAGAKYAGLTAALFATVLNPIAPPFLNAKSPESAKKAHRPFNT